MSDSVFMELTLQPSGKLRPQRTRSYTETILGLLTQRIELVREGGRAADIAALDRTLRVLGYEGEIASLMPAKHFRVFRDGELRRACLNVLEAADRPLMSREIAERVDVARDRPMWRRRLCKYLRASAPIGAPETRRPFRTAEHRSFGSLVNEVLSESRDYMRAR